MLQKNSRQTVILLPTPAYLSPKQTGLKILMLIMSYATSPTQRDILLLGALTALGATMERYVRCSYSGKYQSPCLQTFFVAPPASGKSGLSLIRLLVEPIHDKIRQQVDEEMKAYRKEKKNYELLGKERVNTEAPQMLPTKCFLSRATTAAPAFCKIIMDANGTGLICETEADTIASAISSEYGHWSDTLRKAFDHDRLSYNRRTDQEYREVKRIFLAVLLGFLHKLGPIIELFESCLQLLHILSFGIVGDGHGFVLSVRWKVPSRLSRKRMLFFTFFSQFSQCI